MKTGRTSTWTAAIVLAWSGAAQCAEAAPSGLTGLDACIQRLDPQMDIGYDRIAKRCPELSREVEHSAWSTWLPKGWKDSGNDLSAGSLKELRALADREQVTALGERRPDVSRLRGILAELGEPGGRGVGRWGRFKRWLRSIVEARQQPDEEGWLARVMGHAGFQQSALELLSYTVLGVVVVLAVFIVLNELRATGLLVRKSAARQRPLAVGAAGHLGEHGWQDIQRARVEDRPRLLLELIVTRLSDPVGPPPSRALTVRELAQSARVAEPDDRVRLAELASAAECVRFSGRVVAPEAIEAPLIRGQELLERLTGGRRS